MTQPNSPLAPIVPAGPAGPPRPTIIRSTLRDRDQIFRGWGPRL